MTKTWAEFDPEGYTRQRIAYLENRVAALAKTLDESEVNKMALEAAMDIEEILIQSHRTLVQRRARFQLIIKRCVETALYGEPSYQKYDLHNISEPLT